MYRDRSLDVSSLGLEKLLRLRKITFGEARPPLAAHVHEEKIEIIAVLRGKKSHCIDGMVLTAHRGEYIAVLPGQHHAAGSDRDEKGVHYGLTIYLNRLAALCGRDMLTVLARIRTFKSAAVYESREIVAAFERMEQIVRSGHTRSGKQLLIIDALRDILVLLSEPSVTRTLPAQRRTDAAIRHIRRNIGRTITVGELCELYGASPQSLHRWFMSECGVPPKEFILREKIEAAKRLLSRPSMSVRSCAYKLGFGSETYFSVVFRRFTGMAPSRFPRK